MRRRQGRGVQVDDITAVILDRPRHNDDIVRDPRGRRAHPADPRRRRRGRVSRRWPRSGVNILFGIGGTPEGVIAGAARQGIGGAHAGPALAAQRRRAPRAWSTPAYDLDRVLETDDLVCGDNCFFAATGVTDGDIVTGVRYAATVRPRSRSSCARSSGTIRVVDGVHDRSKLRTVGGYN